MKPWQPTMIGAGQPERFVGQRVGAGFFRALGVLPMLGRDFQASDDQYKGPNVAILSDRLWRRRFSGDPTVIGRQITLDGDLYTVIGVMPSVFRKCTGTGSGDLGATAIQSRSAAGQPRVGPSPANGGTSAAGRQPEAGQK